MRTVLSAFNDRSAAQRAVTNLSAASLTQGRVTLRSDAAGGPAHGDRSLGHPIDEAITGGALTDFAWLLGHLFGSAGAAQPEGSTARLDDGAAIVVVEAADDDEAARVLAFLLQAGATRQARLPQPGDLG